jgi:ribonuclease G
MSKELIINARPHETRVALVEDGVLVELHSERKTGQELLGNIYVGKVTRVLPGMQAAFVDIGVERTAFLYVSDVHLDMLNIERSMFGDLKEDTDLNLDDSETLQNKPFDLINFQIEDLLREGQHIMVQVSKEPLGEKGARLTSYISIPGRHLVLMPKVDHIGVSRLIEDKEKKESLKEIVREIRPNHFGFIVRTISEDASKETLKSEMDFLLKLWADIQKKGENRSSLGLIHEELPVSLRAVRDLFTKEVDRLIIDSNEEYGKITKFIRTFAPSLKHSVEIYDGHNPIFDSFGIENEISRALGPIIPLKSGGHIVIDLTEALTAIDVNTGRYVGKTNLEETILKTNLEAAKEIACQLRLRNIGGLIVIDFISMEEKQNKENVHLTLQQALKRDRVKTNVLTMSDLGLIEMTRKRTRPNLYSLLTEPCTHCEGRGHLKSKKALCYEIFREIERECLIPGENSDVFVSVNPLIGDILREEEKNAIQALEKKLTKRIIIIVKEDFHPERYEIFT